MIANSAGKRATSEVFPRLHEWLLSHDALDPISSADSIAAPVAAAAATARNLQRSAPCAALPSSSSSSSSSSSEDQIQAAQGAAYPANNSIGSHPGANQSAALSTPLQQSLSGGTVDGNPYPPTLLPSRSRL